VRVEDEDYGVSLTVHDTGSGIDAATLPQIFERFFRGDAAHGRDGGSTGLGLAIVRNLLSRMGGRISVQSRPGEGSTFRVELPRSPAEPLPGAGLAEFR
jgi:signal transduction histidine kinase